ncbi:hypothetical protein GALMADRAFT_67759 [Galerina marginata CBS 339.88]|uniref:CxC2-like cysteine cluster KDZ transposase-associated domain-containing protein n=1 Tax=Galerina marginata (strain CBS 339.88) TaxID=685588 RepID=A0A067SYU7_GALM3|nr:hypothetical protein GALMADRAFT_67759 [Galerina marginata CBS 339.88]
MTRSLSLPLLSATGWQLVFANRLVPGTSDTSSETPLEASGSEVPGANTAPQESATESESPSHVEESVQVKTKRKRQTKNTDQLREWLQFRKTFLDETVRHNGLADFLGHTKCLECGVYEGVFKCKDCYSGRMLKCQACIVSIHTDLSLHRVERWNSSFFKKDSLSNLGLHYQLGHSSSPCPCPLPGPASFVVFDVSGFHTVSINYCQCGEEPLPVWKQLLCEGWFPATLSRPQTVFAFDCLETFHKLTLQGKSNLYDYYHTLIQRSDNAKLAKQINHYSEIHCVFRMWRNLMALKRAGRCHDPGGVEATLRGELMVECPACPHPERNLPEGWENAGPLLFLYSLFLAIDGNFKLKGKEHHIKDVELMPGWGVYVPQEEYKAHINNYIDEPEVSHIFLSL